MNAQEFFELLQKYEMNPKMVGEPIPTAEDNFLITWGRTK